MPPKKKTPQKRKPVKRKPTPQKREPVKRKPPTPKKREPKKYRKSPIPRIVKDKKTNNQYVQDPKNNEWIKVDKPNISKTNNINIIVKHSGKDRYLKSAFIDNNRYQRKKYRIGIKEKPTGIKYLNYYRPTPPENPKAYPKGTIRPGNDGKMYKNVQSKNTAKFIWVPVR